MGGYIALECLQRVMRDLYLERDMERGLFRTFAWLVEEIGELAEALQKGDVELAREEIADVIAWTVSIANMLGIDVAEALEEKYPSLARCRT